MGFNLFPLLRHGDGQKGMEMEHVERGRKALGTTFLPQSVRSLQFPATITLVTDQEDMLTPLTGQYRTSLDMRTVPLGSGEWMMKLSRALFF